MALPALQPDDTTLTISDRVRYASTLPAIAKTIYPDTSAARLLKKTALFSLNGFRHSDELQQLQNLFDCPELAPVLELFPAILEKPFSPYVCVDWTLKQRVDQLQYHFQFLKNNFAEKTAEIYKPEGYPLFDIATGDGEQYSVELFPGYQCEGSIGVRLCDAEKREIYTTSFHFSEFPRRTCFIGALQGPNETVPDRQSKIVALTRSMHGLRPKALMVEAVYVLAKRLGIENLYGISNAGHIYQDASYSDAKRASVHFDFDQLWTEYQAEPQSENFFRLPNSPVRKDIASLKSNKRSLYRKRYAWLQDVEVNIESALNDLAVESKLILDFSDVHKAA